MMKKRKFLFNIKYYIYLTAFIWLVVGFYGCKGDHKDYVSVREGRFVDSPVEGITYISGNQTGLTDQNGTFYYEKGQDVTFKIGTIDLGTISTIYELDINTEEVDDELLVVTPRDLVPEAGSDRDPTVTNMLRFLQTLDDDKNPDNGIKLSEDVIKKADECIQEVDFSLSLTEFELKAQPVVNELLNTNRDMVAAVKAQNHFLRSKLQDLMDKTVAEQKIPGIALVAEVPCTLTACEEGSISGVMCVKTDNNCFFSWKLVSGYANLYNKTPLTTDTKFRVASMTKTFVGITILQLAEEGLVDLDKSLEYYLPDLEIPNDENITIRQIVNHSSGLHNFFEVPSTYYIDSLLYRKDLWTLEDLIEGAKTHPAYFPPGMGWHYSNTNYVLLGEIIEKVTNQPWEDEIRDRFIIQYGLKDTIVPETGESNLEGPYNQFSSPNYTDNNKYAHGYIDTYDMTGGMYGQKGGILEDASKREPSSLGSSGCMISSPEDLCKWAKIIGEGDLFGYGNDYINSEVDDELFFPMNPVVTCGPSVYKNKAMNVLIASGNFYGYDVGIVYDSTHKIPIAVCSNRTLISGTGQIKDLITFNAVLMLGGGLDTNGKKSIDSDNEADTSEDSFTYEEKDIFQL